MIDRNIYCVTSTHSIGCTFLDWSILYLSGQSKVFSVDSMRWHNICSNPLTQQQSVVNAHNHIKNHKSGWQRNKDVVSTIYNNTTNREKSISLYPFPLHFDDCCTHLDLDMSAISDELLMQQIWAYQKKDYINMLDWMARDQQIPVIYVSVDPSIKGYHWTTRSLDRLSWSPKKPTCTQEVDQEFQDVFFSRSQQCWQDLGLDELWDVRERMALDIRPFSEHWANDLILAHDHYWIHCQDLWFDTEQTVRTIMLWLDLDLIEDRVQQWLPIVRSWQQIHNNNLRFPRHLSKILGSIVHGHKHDISNLTFNQEVIIQHCLIYQFGLNLKTWKLDKFPDCASQLHALLELNLHPLS